MHEQLKTEVLCETLLYQCLSSSSEDPYPSNSIDLKCKERVTDSDSDNGSGDESDQKVTSSNHKPTPQRKSKINQSIFTFLSVFLFPQRVFAPVICSSTLSSSTHQHVPHGRSVSLSSYHSRTRYDEGRPGGAGGGHFSDPRRKERGEGEGGGTDGGGAQAVSLSLPASQTLLSGPPPSGTAPSSLGLNPLRVASTVVTNVMRPVISTPLPIASKPREGGMSSSPHPPDRKSLTPQQQQPQLLIGPGGGAAGGGAYFASSSPNPVAAGPGGVVTNLLLGGALSAQPAVQLISPSPQPQPAQHQTLPAAAAISAPHGHTNGPLPVPLLQPQFLPTSSLVPPGGKAITQVQYILPTLPASAHPQSPPQQLSQTPGIFNLPTAPPMQHISLANGKQQVSGSLAGFTSSQAVGVVSPGARGETRVHRS